MADADFQATSVFKGLVGLLDLVYVTITTSSRSGTIISCVHTHDDAVINVLVLQNQLVGWLVTVGDNLCQCVTQSLSVMVAECDQQTSAALAMAMASIGPAATDDVGAVPSCKQSTLKYNSTVTVE